MFVQSGLSFVNNYVEQLDNALRKADSKYGLSYLQKLWFSFCLMGIYMSNSVCWAKFSRMSLGDRSDSGISWMFLKANIAWDKLLESSTLVLFSQYHIKSGVLALDEVDRARSKHTSMIFKSYKQRDKPSSGYVNGQTIVVLTLVANDITFPVGFEFYMPDPVKKQWNIEDKKLRKKGIAKKSRPAAPAADLKYPTKIDISLSLLRSFHEKHSTIKVKAVVADALYGTAYFMDSASNIFNGIQVVSQLRADQNVHFRNRKQSVGRYFQSYPGVSQAIKIRGSDPTAVTIGSIRVHVCAHAKKRFVIALKYKGEDKYRYLVATDMAWRTVDIAQVYTLRWLIEVFFEDWKSYEGWGQLAKQPGEKGSVRGLILSLLSDHCLLLHPEQKARIEKKLPAYTVGSLQRRIQADAFVMCLYQLLEERVQNEKIEKIKATIQQVFELKISKKHMSGKDLGRLEPTPALKYRAAFI